MNFTLFTGSWTFSNDKAGKEIVIVQLESAGGVSSDYISDLLLVKFFLFSYWS